MPWIFMCLMAINAIFFGWKFMEVSVPQSQVREKTPLQIGARVQLLSESKLPRVAIVAAVEDQPVAPAALVQDGPATRQCFNVGPFPAESEVRSFVGGMKGKRFVARADKRRVDIKDFWVFIPAFTNRDKAEERLRDIKSRGISGFVVKEGVFVNAISLNHFSQRELAQAFLVKMQEAGVTVEYRELASVGAEHWVYVSPGQSRDDLRSGVDAYLAGKTGLKREITACED